MNDANQINNLIKNGQAFFTQLKKNNNRGWFHKNKDIYDTQILNPARQFVGSMGVALQPLIPRIIADPRINKSIFRQNRDIRFSKDKSPYKEHLGILLWDNRQKKMESSGFYFHLEYDHLFLAVGIHTFSKEILDNYRDAVSIPSKNESLNKIHKNLEKAGYSIEGEKYKRYPPDYNTNVSNAGLLLNKGLYVSHKVTELSQIDSKDIIPYCFNHYKKMLPIHRWLTDNLF